MSSSKESPRNSLPSLWEINFARECAARARKHAHRIAKATRVFDAAVDDLARLRAQRGIKTKGSVGEKIDDEGIDYVWQGSSILCLNADDAPTVCAWADGFADSARTVYNNGEEDGEWDKTRLAVIAMYAVRATDATDDAIEAIGRALAGEEADRQKARRAWRRVLRAAETQWRESSE